MAFFIILKKSGSVSNDVLSKSKNKLLVWIRWAQKTKKYYQKPSLQRLLVSPKGDSPIQQSPQEDPTGAIDISVNKQPTPSTPEHLPPSQLRIHPPTPAAGLAGAGLRLKDNLL